MNSAIHFIKKECHGLSLQHILMKITQEGYLVLIEDSQEWESMDVPMQCFKIKILENRESPMLLEFIFPVHYGYPVDIEDNNILDLTSSVYDRDVEKLAIFLGWENDEKGIEAII